MKNIYLFDLGDVITVKERRNGEVVETDFKCINHKLGYGFFDYKSCEFLFHPVGNMVDLTYGLDKVQVKDFFIGWELKEEL